MFSKRGEAMASPPMFTSPLPTPAQKRGDRSTHKVRPYWTKGRSLRERVGTQSSCLRLSIAGITFIFRLITATTSTVHVCPVYELTTEQSINPSRSHTARDVHPALGYPATSSASC